MTFINQEYIPSRIVEVIFYRMTGVLCAVTVSSQLFQKQTETGENCLLTALQISPFIR